MSLPVSAVRRVALRVPTLLVALAAACGLHERASAADVSWNTTTGAYNVGANWSGGVVPTGTDVAVIANGGASTLTLSGSTAGAQLAIGRDGAGSLVIAGSGTHTVTAPAFIGYTTASSAVAGAGSLTVGSGATLRIETGGDLLVGTSGGALGSSGTVAINAGGELFYSSPGGSILIGDTRDGSTSTAALDVAGTLTVAVGELTVGRGQGGGGTGTGVLTLGPGGLVTTNSWTKFGADVPFGPNGGGVGRLVMTGGTFNKVGTGRMVFGVFNGTGELTQSGGVINVGGASEGFVIGAYGAQGVGTYTLSSGTLSVTSGLLSIGNAGGRGTFTMTGGLVQKTSPQDFEIGEGGAGSMTVTGGLVDIQAGDLAIGKWGASGTLAIGGSGIVQAGNVVFSKNAPTPSATLTLNAGGLLRAARISSANATGTTQLIFDGGTLAATGNEPAFMGGLSSAQIDAGGATIDSQAFNVTMAQPLSGAGSLTKVGSGTLTMTGAGSYSGPTTVSQGGLTLTTAHTGGGAVTVASGATLGVTVAGSVDSQLALSSLGLGAGSSLTIDLASFGNPSVAPLNVLGGLTTSGGSTVINFASGAPATGTVPLVSYGSLNAFNFTLGTLPTGMSASLVNNTAANRIDLSISSIPIRRWQGNVSAAWDTTTSNWVATFSGPGPSAVFTNGDGPILFTDEATGPTAVTLNTTVQPLATSFTNNTLPYSLTGTGTIGGSGGLTKSGAAALTLGTRNTYTGATRLEGGTTSVAVLANGGVASGIGASTAAPGNLVFAGGALEYTGTSVTTTRGFTLSGSGGSIGVTQTTALLTFSGTVAADAGSLRKTGPGNLRLTGTSNVLGKVGDGAGLIVESGSLQLFGTSPANPAGQINSVTGDVQVGAVADTGASLAMTNSTLNVTGWLSLGHETGTANVAASLTRATINAGNLRLGYAATANSGSHSLTLTNASVVVANEALIGNIGPSVGVLSLTGTSRFSAGGDTNIGNVGGTQGIVTVGGSATFAVSGRLRVGDLGAGSLTATGTSRLNVDQVQIGNGLSATGTMTVNGDSVVTSVGYIAAGNNGVGTLAVADRGRVDVVFDLNMGDLGGSNGTLTIGDRGAVSAGSVFVGKGDASIGAVTVTGGTLTQTSPTGQFIVGRQAQSATLTVSGSGTVVATATSGLQISSEELSQGATVNLDGGVLEVARISKGTGLNAGLVLNGGTLRARSTASGSLISGLDSVLVLPGGAVINTNGATVSIDQGLADGGGGLTKAGAGTLVLTAPNTYSGATAVTAGTLRVDGDNSFAAGPVTVSSGATLAGTGTVGGATTIQAGATLSPGASPGTLTFTQGVTLAAGGNYNWQLYNATGTAGASNGWDLISVGGVLNVAATSGSKFNINLWSLSGIGPDVNGNALNFSSATSGTWRIATAAGGITGFSADKFALVTSATNGTGGFSNPFAGTFSLAQSGNNLNLVYTGAAPAVITINVPSGTQTQAVAGFPLLTGTTPVQKTGTGTVVFNATNTLSGPTTVSQGTLQLATADTLSTSAVTVAAGAKLSVGPQVAAVVPSLVNNGLVDVGLGSLTITSGQGPATLVAAIVAGRNDGTWDGTTGITSSAAATQGERAVGWLDNGDGSFLVGYAAAGDWNVNGIVDFDDVVQFVSAGLFDTGLPATWAQGDYDYNGVVDFDDVLAQSAAGLFDAGPYNAPPGGMAPLALGDPAALAGGFAAVPEPAAWVLGVIGCGVAGLASRRRASRRVTAAA